MSLAWRLDKAGRSQKESFSGEGAYQYGGRWNHPGARIIYTSDSLSLAVLEKFVHVAYEGKHLHWISYCLIIPSSIRMDKVELNQLPTDWRQSPPMPAAKNIGTDWAKQVKSAILRIPSVLVPAQYNFLLNPNHHDFRKIRIVTSKPFDFDPRMWKQRTSV